MPRSLRSRNLWRRCQVAKAGPDGRPLRDDAGGYALAAGGQWFLVVSGGDHHDNKRVCPADPDAFFAHLAAEATRARQARGLAGAVTVPMVHAEYARRFTRPAGTYFPPGQPEEFSLLVPKALCVNLGVTAGGPGGSGRSDPSAFLDDASVLACLEAGPDALTPPADPPPAADEPTGRRRKGKPAPAAAAAPGDPDFDLLA